MQFDIHTPALTVKEALRFSARLRLSDVTPQQMDEFVDEVHPLLFLISYLTSYFACTYQSRLCEVNAGLTPSRRMNSWMRSGISKIIPLRYRIPYCLL